MFTIKKIIKNKLWIPATLAIIITTVVIPLALYLNSSIQIPNGTYIKTGSRFFYEFLDKVKKTKGVIILGTSETANDMNGNNYWGLLNKDKESNKNFYPLSGAGRCFYVYFPLILNNPEAFRNLEIIYYINPTYLRKGLNDFNTEYFNRYIDTSFVCSVKQKAQERHIYNEFMKSEIGCNEKKRSVSKMDEMIDHFKGIYYYDMKYFLTNYEPEYPKKININDTDVKTEELKNKINLRYNVTNDFLTKEIPFPAIDTGSVFQYDMLRTAINLIKEYNIRCTFYIGPFNEIYCKEKKPELLDEYYKVMDNIKKILEAGEVPFIDGSVQSTIPGTFTDIQHISEYGAYLTALQIKEYYEKNK